MLKKKTKKKQRTSQQVNTFVSYFLGIHQGNLQTLLRRIAAVMMHPCNCSLFRLLVVMCIVLHGIGKVII